MQQQLKNVTTVRLDDMQLAIALSMELRAARSPAGSSADDLQRTIRVRHRVDAGDRATAGVLDP
jgi:hypothetical protein